MRPLIFIIIILVSGCGLESSAPFIHNGKLDLSHWDFTQQGSVDLNGNWQYLNNQLLSFDELSNKEQITQGRFAYLPGQWGGLKHQRQTQGTYGIANYRLTINLPSDSIKLALRFRNIASAHQLWVNGQSYVEHGQVGRNEIDSQPKMNHYIIPLNIKSRQLEIILQVSNFHLSRGGVLEAITIGQHEQLQQQFYIEQTLDLLVAGGLWLMALYFFSRYLTAKIVIKYTDVAGNWFVAVCLLWGMHILFWGVSGHSVLRFWPQMEWELFIRLDYIIFYLAVPVLTNFIAVLFPKESIPKLSKFWLLLGVLFSLQALLTSSDVYSKFLPFYEFLSIFQLAYIFWILMRAYKHGREGATAVLLGMLVFSIATVFALLSEIGFIVSTYLAPLSLYALVFSQAHTLSIREIQSFLKIEKLSNKLEEKNIILRNSDQLKDEFLANTSHELRTPLNGIVGLAESLLHSDKVNFDKRQQHDLLLISNSGRRLAYLVNDILDYSRLKSRELILKTRAVDLFSLINTVLTMCTPLIANKPLNLLNQVDNHLPAVLGDEDRLQQIFYNLIGNAIKYTQQGIVQIMAEIKGQHIRVAIQDSGVGIAEERIETIFHPFEQIDTASSYHSEGAGLGLGITRQLIELHGSSLVIESQPGQGSTFSFTLPVCEKKLTTKAIDKSVVQKNYNTLLLEYTNIHKLDIASKTDNKGIHILVVDDDLINLRVADNHLSSDGLMVTTASGGVAALELIESGKQFDLVLLDIMMPDINGIEVCRRLRHRYTAVQLPVIIVTAKNRLSDLVQGLSIGANDYLTKPFVREELLARIHAQLKVRAAHYALQENALLKKELKQEQTVAKQLQNEDYTKEQDKNLYQNQRQLLVEIMNHSLDLWIEQTAMTKIELAQNSKLWKVYMDDDGWERTQTLDRYLHLDTLPKRPRIRQILNTANYVLEHCKDNTKASEQLCQLMQQLSDS
ncbi:MAG: response regulator [gamma proteobacterium symbiont of Taylorina sp.]|nr:response regulator [gamma proteobacterium symbiont of Taylorina sp.]